MSKILITGGNGFLGVSLGKFYSKNNEVLLGSRNNLKNFAAKSKSGCEICPLDVSNIESVRDCINQFKPEIIIHAAATKYVQLSEEFPFECIDTNVVGSQNIARVAIEKNIDTVIGISTDKTAPPIGNIYGLSKSLMEKMYCSLNTKAKTNFSCVRFGNIAWSSGSVFPIWKNMMKEKNLIESTGPNMKRFFFNIDQAISLVNVCLKSINITNGKVLSKKMKCAKISDILDIWCDHYKTSWKEIAKRKGDKDDEYLIGEIEKDYTSEVIIEDDSFFLLDFYIKSKKPISDSYSTQNAEKLSLDEIIELIKIGN
tara:strand:+ start:1939 stop:2877 length:939 start_codon:yes stop_codon:yes gene_type:complete